jgi:hypothetical protein
MTLNQQMEVSKWNTPLFSYTVELLDQQQKSGCKKLGQYRSSSSSISHGVGPLVDPFRSYLSRSLFKGLP